MKQTLHLVQFDLEDLILQSSLPKHHGLSNLWVARRFFSRPNPMSNNQNCFHCSTKGAVFRLG